WIRWYGEWAKEQAAAEGDLAAALAKLEEAAARMALIHHVVTHLGLDTDDLRDVGVRSVEAGVMLARWFAAGGRGVYAILAESTEDRDTRRWVEWIQTRGGTVTAKELQRSNSRKYPTAEAATQALDALAEGGYGDWRDRPAGGQGGRPTRDFILRPTTD